MVRSPPPPCPQTNHPCLTCEQGLDATAANLEQLLKTLNIRGELTPSLLVVKLTACGFAGLLALVTVLPAFRFSRAYYDLTTQHIAPLPTRYVAP